jgi:hypothetical protein
MKKNVLSRRLISFFVSAVFAGAIFLTRKDGLGLADMPGSPEKFSDAEWKEFREYGENVLEKTLNAYNMGNYEKFVENFSAKRRALTRRAFGAIWQGDYKERYGDFISRAFFPEKSNQVKNYPLLTYRAIFVENSEVGIRCVFVRDDDGEYRIFYLRFDPYQDLFY